MSGESTVAGGARGSAARVVSVAPPSARRTELNYPGAAAVVADLRRLRRGYARTGAWSLEQACWHLRAATEAVLRPPAGPATPEQAAARPVLEQVLAGAYPPGLDAPGPFVPPADAGPGEVDALVETLGRLVAYPHPTAAHRRFGPVTRDELVRLVLVHCAHHLGFLVPVGA
ncbi:MAG: hypothetical protein JWO31_2190 [Phycisphaerales bacterium]|nr:hypothetical protein [Phycisphaerales bacterium]